MTDSKLNIGKGIKRALLEKEMTQVDLAKKIGVSKTFMGSTCNKPNVGMNFTAKVAKALGMKISALIALSED